MEDITCAMISLQSLMQELGVVSYTCILINSDNQDIVFTTRNPIFHDQMKLMKQNYHYIREKVLKGVISTSHVELSDQLANYIPNPLSSISYDSLGTKLGIFIYTL